MAEEKIYAMGKNPNSLANLTHRFPKGSKFGNRFKKGQSPWNKGMTGFLADEKHYNWKGDDVGYRALHDWVEKFKGKASYCEKCGKEKTSPRSIHWANIDHKYRRVLDDYISLCQKCHLAYDIENGFRERPNYGKIKS